MINICSSKDFGNFYKDTKIVLSPEVYRLQVLEESSITNPEYELISDDLKIVLSFQQEFFHLLIDTFCIVIDQFVKNNNILFVIDSSKIRKQEVVQKEIDEVLHIFDKIGIKYKFVNLDNGIKINNFYLYSPDETENYPFLTIFQNTFNTIKKFFPDLVNLPTRNVYLSRKNYVCKTRTTDIVDDDNKPLFNDDIRIDSEAALEEYFSNLGYEIIDSSNNSGILDNIKLFSSIKKLVSPTGAALANSVFMHPETTIVELSVPMGIQRFDMSWSFDWHTHYYVICANSKQRYISIPSSRSAEEIIKNIDSDKYFKNFLESK